MYMIEGEGGLLPLPLLFMISPIIVFNDHMVGLERKFHHVEILILSIHIYTH